MSKIIDVEDILYGARNCIECIFLAASDIGDETGPIQGVADIASAKISEAIAILVECRGGPDASPVPAAPSAKPKSPAARTTKRRAK